MRGLWAIEHKRDNIYVYARWYTRGVHIKGHVVPYLFASDNTWFAGPAVSLGTECMHLHNKRGGCTHYCLPGSIVTYRVLCEVWYCVWRQIRVQGWGADSRWCTTVGRARHDAWLDGFRERNRFTSSGAIDCRHVVVTVWWWNLRRWLCRWLEGHTSNMACI